MHKQMPFRIEWHKFTRTCVWAYAGERANGARVCLHLLSTPRACVTVAVVIRGGSRSWLVRELYIINLVAHGEEERGRGVGRHTGSTHAQPSPNRIASARGARNGCSCAARCSHVRTLMCMRIECSIGGTRKPVYTHFWPKCAHNSCAQCTAFGLSLDWCAGLTGRSSPYRRVVSEFSK